MILFVLGRQPEISLAELNAVFGKPSQLIDRQVALMDIDKSTALAQAKRLGSIVKIAEIIDTLPQLNRDSLADVLNKLFAQIEGKITLGVSIYGKGTSKKSAINLGQDISGILKQSSHSIRLVPTDGAELSSATVLHNKLAHGNPKKVELIVTKAPSAIIARTIYVQDINAYTFRDRRRPKRDARNGMLPPKLAQTMVNLAYGATLSKLSIAPSVDLPSPAPLSGEPQVKPHVNLLDPFCGTGVVLQEAALMGMQVYGTDLNPQMIDYTQTNLDWLKQTHHIDFNYKLSAGDATNFDWQTWTKPDRIDLVATETYLGRPYTTVPPMDQLRENINDCNTIIGKFLENMAKQLAAGTGLCLGVPCWFVRNKAHHLAIASELARFGFTDTMPNRHLVYHRQEQIVGRELLVLQKR